MHFQSMRLISNDTDYKHPKHEAEKDIQSAESATKLLLKEQITDKNNKHHISQNTTTARSSHKKPTMWSCQHQSASELSQARIRLHLCWSSMIMLILAGRLAQPPKQINRTFPPVIANRFTDLKMNDIKNDRPFNLVLPNRSSELGW
eukprot:c27327_g1_i4 orf=1181-1621(+)